MIDLIISVYSRVKTTNKQKAAKKQTNKQQ